MSLSNHRTHTFDAATEMKDAGLVAASAAATVDSAAKILDVGDSVLEGALIIDVSAVEIADNNELFTVSLQGSNSSSFASGIENLAMLDFGATEVRKGGAIDSVAGRYELGFCNVQGGVTYKYLRVYTTVAGTVGTGINYTAWISKH